MAIKLDSLRTDAKKVSEGIRVPFQGLTLLVGKYQSPAMQAWIAEKTQHLRDTETGTIAPQHAEAAAEIMERAISKFVFKGWEGDLVDGKGKALVPDEETRYGLLQDETLDEMRKKIMGASTKAARYMVDVPEAIAGN